MNGDMGDNSLNDATEKTNGNGNNKSDNMKVFHENIKIQNSIPFETNSRQCDSNARKTETEVYSSRLRSRNSSKSGANLACQEQKSSENMDLPSCGLLAISRGTTNVESTTKGRRNDPYCWNCHKDRVSMECVVCPRSFHNRCINKISDSKLPNLSPAKDWVCPECTHIMELEDLNSSTDNQPRLSLDQLCILLQFLVHRLKHAYIEPFLKPVSLTSFPSYLNFVIHPMDILNLECNIKKKVYGCVYSFLSDFRWILHNCVIFNGYHHKLTNLARNLLKICKTELSEMETCPSCYLNSYRKVENSFSKPCAELHTLIWAKMKGFPFWPAKAVKIVDNNVDTRFFGAHDRAWVPISHCFLYSKELPVAPKTKKKGFDEAVEEVELYIELVKKEFGDYKYAEPKVPLKPEHVQMPKKFNLDMSWFERQQFKSQANDNSESSMKNNTDIHSNVQYSDEGSCDTNSSYQNGSYNSQLTSTNYETSLKCTQSLSINISSCTKSESDNITFGGTVSPETPSKNIPLGVFELSPNVKTTMPRKLNVKVPTLKLNRPNKSRSSDQVQKLEVAIGKIKDGFQTDDNVHNTPGLEDFESCNEHTTNVMQGSNVLNIPSPFQGILSKRIVKQEISKSSLFPNQLKRQMPVNQKNSSIYVKNLGKTIENCKAVLGINVFDDVALVESESDSEDNNDQNNQIASKNLSLLNDSCETNKSSDSSESSAPTCIPEPNNAPFNSYEEPTDVNNKRKFNTHTSHDSKRLKVSKLYSLDGGNFHNNDPSKDMISRTDVEKYTNKVMDFMKGTMEEMCKECGSNYQNAANDAFRLEIDMLNLRHQQEVAEMAHNAKLVLMEMSTCMEMDKRKAIAQMKEKNEKNIKEAISRAKKQQWCANCGKEAIFYCCWNTSYCDLHCQHKHWAKHMGQCTQSVPLTSGSRQSQANPEKFDRNTFTNSTIPSESSNSKNSKKEIFENNTQISTLNASISTENYRLTTSTQALSTESSLINCHTVPTSVYPSVALNFKQ